MGQPDVCGEVHCNSSTQELRQEDDRKAQSQPGMQSETLFYEQNQGFKEGDVVP